MSEQLTHGRFADCVGDTFSVEFDDGQAGPMELIEAKLLPTREAQVRNDPFSLVFRHVDQHVHPQQMYRLQHQQLGSLDVFLVPIGPDEQGMRYEAVFN